MRKEIKASCAYLPLGESIRTICPYCNGGKSKELSLACTRTATGILWHCKRASCGKGGIIGEIPPKTVGADKVKKKTRAYKGNLCLLSEIDWAVHFGVYGISLSKCLEQGIQSAVDINRIYMPIYNLSGYQIGENLRALGKDQLPKSIKNKFNEKEPLIHCPLGTKVEKVLVLVEDQTSAIKASKVIPTVALMGTNITDEAVELFRSAGVEEIIMCLDGDTAGITATLKAVKKLSPFFKVKATHPPKGKDPKNLSIQELTQLLC